ncbi:hypothetical protein [Hungatella hathewayi]|uniref:hypothetical protein n=1 Tax=Hungatella hathewayi TaxID=154046 RepID=UPI0035653348
MNEKTENGKIIEVLIYTSYGLSCLPSCVSTAVDENPEGPLRERTGKVIERIRKFAIKIETLEGIDEKKLIRIMKENGIVYIKPLDCYFYLMDNDPLEHIKRLSIEQVDISRPWIISEYDGSESIRYLEVMDEFVNFHRLR